MKRTSLLQGSGIGDQGIGIRELADLRRRVPVY
jgi:hypothetical protein